MNKVFFLTVKTPHEKISTICHIAQKHFLKKEKLLYFVTDKPSLLFVDELLWKTGVDSFLPHYAIDISDLAPSKTLSEELILITTVHKNLNNSKILFNLSSDPLFWTKEISILFELEDKTSAQRLESSKKRYLAYRDAGYSISLEP